MRKIISGRRGGSEGFMMTIDTRRVSPTGGNSGPLQFCFPIRTGTDANGASVYPVNFEVDWGDGTTSFIDSTNFATNRLHNYPAQSNYTITAKGSVAGFNFWNMQDLSASNLYDACKLISIEQWGDLIMTRGAPAGTGPQSGQCFRSCVNLSTITATDIPTWGDDKASRAMFSQCANLSSITNLNNWYMNGTIHPVFNYIPNLYSMFNGCTSLQYQGGSQNIDLSLWDVTNVSIMHRMFQNCDKFNGVMWKNLRSAGVSIYNMFFGAANFNNGGSSVGIQQWNTDNVTDMRSMFQSATNFNRDISAWNTGNVTNMEYMFAGLSTAATTFNQPIGSWNTSNVTNMKGMFTYNPNFDQDIKNWDISKWSQVNSTEFPLTNAPSPSLNLSTSNYNALLVAWDAYSYPSWPVGNTVNFGSSQYSLTSPGNSVVNARNSLIAKWGIIADGGGI